ncbi:unnamed protein product [Adineta ricciae]|uniref:Dynein light chain n=1 Tax=Adineta ricciae TaxID=249248 RepID=A0A814QYM0_ADIRI|nr:unnamed protein product [Adineta ricciae]CAF1489792.1 unnamed protein product [Adineta ricciae]
MQSYHLSILILCLVFLFSRGNASSPPNVVVRISNMTESMNTDAVRITKLAFTKFNGYSLKSRAALAKYIRYQFDQLHSPSWQCILGKDFALSITSDDEKRIILDVGKVAVLIFKGKC